MDNDEMHKLLGYTVVDSVTGFTGVVTGVVYYLSGCNQALVIPRAAPDGAYRDGIWFDIQRLKVLPAVGPIELDNGQTPGSDHTPPVR